MKTRNLHMIVFSAIFALIAIASFIGGFIGHTWHFWTALLSGILSITLFNVKDKENGN